METAVNMSFKAPGSSEVSLHTNPRPKGRARARLSASFPPAVTSTQGQRTYTHNTRMYIGMYVYTLVYIG